LLSHNDIGPSGFDEGKKYWPEVPFVLLAFLLARDGKWLAGATSCPNRSVVGPSGKAKGEAPSADAGEEVTLRVSHEVVRSDIDNAPVVNVARRNQPSRDEVSQPLGCVWIEFVVVGPPAHVVDPLSRAARERT